MNEIPKIPQENLPDKKPELLPEGRYMVSEITTFFMGESAVTLPVGVKFDLKISGGDLIWLKFDNGMEIQLDPSNVQKNGFHVEKIW